MTGIRAHLGVGIALAFLALFSPDRIRSDDFEGRALWIVRTTLTSRASIDRAIEHAVEGGFRILFVQAVGRGDAFYPSAILPASEMLEGGSEDDPFGYFLERAHQKGLEVHLWMNLLYVWSSPKSPVSPSHVVRSHPEWLVVNRESSRNSQPRRNHFTRDPDLDRFLSPALPEVRQHLVHVVEEILKKYPVDGLHLDYIRYPTGETGFEDFARGAFFALYRIDPLAIFELEPNIGAVDEDDDRARLERQWRQWRGRQVTDLLRKIREVQISIAPGITLSAAVIPDIERARSVYGQDWPAWANEGLVDLVVTMSYSKSKGVVLSQARKAREAILKGRLFVGIAAYNQPLNNMLNCARELKSIDIDGISLFSYNAIVERPEDFSRIRRSIFGDPTSAGSAGPK